MFDSIVVKLISSSSLFTVTKNAGLIAAMLCAVSSCNACSWLTCAVAKFDGILVSRLKLQTQLRLVWRLSQLSRNFQELL
jgi:hypothetical protein